MLIIPEENEPFGKVIGSADAPYLTGLAQQFGSAAAMQAGYPVQCPSLAAYIELTSGDRGGICDDRNPKAHRLSGDSVFSQVASSGRQWRVYAESMPTPCSEVNSKDGLYAVRHSAAPYYASETGSGRCGRWQLPMGGLSSGALRDDVSGGKLPSFSLVVPNLCNDMHGAPGCYDHVVRRGDGWLREWLPVLMAGPDYRARRLLILITWDEGSKTDNHIPTLVIAPGVTKGSVSGSFTHCSTLRTVQDVLGLPPLGCAAQATALTAAFGLR